MCQPLRGQPNAILHDPPWTPSSVQTQCPSQVLPCQLGPAESQGGLWSHRALSRSQVTCTSLLRACLEQAQLCKGLWLLRPGA